MFVFPFFFSLLGSTRQLCCTRGCRMRPVEMGPAGTIPAPPGAFATLPIHRPSLTQQGQLQVCKPSTAAPREIRQRSGQSDPFAATSGANTRSTLAEQVSGLSDWSQNHVYLCQTMLRMHMMTVLFTYIERPKQSFPK